jgi:hypothetical protein
MITPFLICFVFFVLAVSDIASTDPTRQSEPSSSFDFSFSFSASLSSTLIGANVSFLLGTRGAFVLDGPA